MIMGKLKKILVKNRSVLMMSDRKVFEEISKRARAVAKESFPDDKERMVKGANLYLKGMIDTVELIYN